MTLPRGVWKKWLSSNQKSQVGISSSVQIAAKRAEIRVKARYLQVLSSARNILRFPRFGPSRRLRIRFDARAGWSEPAETTRGRTQEGARWRADGRTRSRAARTVTF